MLMHQLLEDGASRHPDKLAFRWVDRDKTLTFSEAAAAMERYAGALHHLGVRKGDRVTIFAHNGMDYLLGLFACWRIGAMADDPRVADGVAFVSGLQGRFGLWEYAARPQVSRWVTFDLLPSLPRLKGGEPGEWISLEPRTPFQAYPQRRKRY